MLVVAVVAVALLFLPYVSRDVFVRLCLYVPTYGCREEARKKVIFDKEKRQIMRNEWIR